MEIIAGTIFEYYTHAVNEAGWDSREGGYLGDTFDTWELIRDRFGEPSNREAVNDAIIESLGDETWCKLHMYSVDGVDRYIASWTDFCSTVKHKSRYFFDITKQEEDFPETIPVPRMLDELRDIISEVSLVGPLPVTTRFFRVRQHSRAEVCNTWQSLGPPPDSAAISNRMSAAGISMFLRRIRHGDGASRGLSKHLDWRARSDGCRMDQHARTQRTGPDKTSGCSQHLRHASPRKRSFGVSPQVRAGHHTARRTRREGAHRICSDTDSHGVLPPSVHRRMVLRTSTGSSTRALIVGMDGQSRSSRRKQDLNPDHWDNKPNPMLVLDPQSVVRVKPSTRRHSTQHGSNSSVVAGTSRAKR